MRGKAIINSIEIGATYSAERMAKMEMTIPSVNEPLSPMNIFAGCQLNNKNANTVTIKKEESEISS